MPSISTAISCGKPFSRGLVLAGLGLCANSYAEVRQWPVTAGGNGHWYQIMAVPTLIFFRDGTPVDKFTGLLGKNELKKKLDTLIEG